MERRSTTAKSKMVQHNAMIIAEHEVPNDRRTDQYRFESCIARGTNQKAGLLEGISGREEERENAKRAKREEKKAKKRTERRTRREIGRV
jgi:hypothetical protein